MKERPIIMSGDNPRLILEGSKTQTRRLVKIKAEDAKYTFVENRELRREARWVSFVVPCPYGIAGDRLWVRETWAVRDFCVCCESARPNVAGKATDIELGPKYHPVIHKSGKENFAWGMSGPPKWKSPRYMSRTASRITLEITKVRVERLQDISEEDAKAEGVQPTAFHDPLNYIGPYRLLWDSLHGEGAWEENPWVWVIEFTKRNPE